MCAERETFGRGNRFPLVEYERSKNFASSHQNSVWTVKSFLKGNSADLNSEFLNCSYKSHRSPNRISFYSCRQSYWIVISDYAFRCQLFSSTPRATAHFISLVRNAYFICDYILLKRQVFTESFLSVTQPHSSGKRVRHVLPVLIKSDGCFARSRRQRLSRARCEIGPIYSKNYLHLANGRTCRRYTPEDKRSTPERDSPPEKFLRGCSQKIPGA